MFCPKCGKQNPDNAVFCGGCANPLQTRATAQQQQQVQWGYQPQQQVYQQPQQPARQYQQVAPRTAQGAYAMQTPYAQYAGGAVAAGAIKPKRKFPVIPVAIAVVVVAAVVAAGFLTNWFGFAGEKVWVKTGYSYTMVRHDSNEANTMTYSYQRDDRGNIVSKTIIRDGQTVTIAYTRDADGYITSARGSMVGEEDTIQIDRANTLDNKGRIVSAAYRFSGMADPGLTATFEYYGDTDTISAITYKCESYEPTSMNSLTYFDDMFPGINFAWGLLGQRDEARVTFSGQGVASIDGQSSSVGDPRMLDRNQRKGQTITITPREGITLSYTYDNDGNLIRQTQENSDPNYDATTTTIDLQWTAVANPSHNLRIFENLGAA